LLATVSEACWISRTSSGAKGLNLFRLPVDALRHVRNLLHKDVGQETCDIGQSFPSGNAIDKKLM
jgi:hypothetical protein